MQRTLAVADRAVVTPPRQIIPGQACFVTVRAVNRSYRFVPKRDVREAIAFCLATTLAKFKNRIALHEFLWMSNHFHLVLTDVAGCMPAFMEALNSLLSRALNALRGIKGTNIEKGYNLVVVHGEARLLEHCVYTLANPCRAHLVTRSRHWEGVSSLKMHYGVPLRVKRPARGLWSNGSTARRGSSGVTSNKGSRPRKSTLPEAVDLVLERPPISLELSDAELRRHIRERLDARELELIGIRRSTGKCVLGWKEVVKASFLAIPARAEQLFKTTPSSSATDSTTRQRLAQERRSFLDEYRAALVRFIRGERGVRFPIGTWLMKVRFGAVCCPLPAT